MEWRPLDRLLDEALALYEKWGVAGIKVDFMNRDDQEMVNLCAKWVRKAAEHHLVVDLHGASKETGLRRTYPNLLTLEGVMGAEKPPPWRGGKIHLSERKFVASRKKQILIFFFKTHQKRSTA